MWISYAPLDRVRENIQDLTQVSNHQLLAQPLGGWENHHIGAGAPPLLTEEGWLLYYHGVLGSSPPGVRLPDDVMVYQSGIMLLDGTDPRRVYFRSSRPVLVPQLESERHGVVPNVVFPTAVDVRGRRIDVYYGAADLCIAAATTEIGCPVLMAPSASPRRESAARSPQVAAVRWDSVARDREAGDREASGIVSTKRVQGTGGGASVLVKDVMTPTVEVIGPTTTLEEAAARMRALNIGMLPVRAGNALVGVITDRDMAVRAMAQGLDPKAAEVGGVMTPGVVSCFDDQSVEEAASIMATYRVRRLVVVDGAMRPMGIISLDDVAAGAENPALAGQTLIRTSARPDRVYGYRRLLVALDGSKFAERILPSILPLADKFESTVTLVQAVAPVKAPALTEVPLAVASDDWTVPATPIADEMRAHAESYLTGVQQVLEARGLAVETTYPEGEPSEVILAEARRIAADVIAITTHGRTGVDRMLFGSVAEDVLRRAPCPVLLVRVQDGL
jgi:nucleotide-binding universal stress UspA family protein/CBS domain-containing protein